MDISQVWDSMSEKEQQILMDHAELEAQLRNLRRVMNGSITPKKLKKLETIDLPFVITKEFNARQKAEQVMKKKGFIRK